ncbi:MAG: orotate phosphoribosyltransferase, partial [Clostridiales bacterium]|nr:orotate phosphoribosyltransferase [Clostridiales bacterium]
VYVQPARLFESARMAEEVVAPLAKHFEDMGAQQVLGAALGGMLAGYEVSRAMDLPYIFSERKDGAMTLPRGFTITPGTKVFLSEDEGQTGTSVREMTEIVRALGGEVGGTGCIVDKSGGKLHFEAPFMALLSVQVTHYLPKDCPLCKDGIEMEPSP